jgi:hypothetical protein
MGSEERERAAQGRARVDTRPTGRSTEETDGGETAAPDMEPEEGREEEAQGGGPEDGRAEATEDTPEQEAQRRSRKTEKHAWIMTYNTCGFHLRAREAGGRKIGGGWGSGTDLRARRVVQQTCYLWNWN